MGKQGCAEIIVDCSEAFDIQVTVHRDKFL